MSRRLPAVPAPLEAAARRGLGVVARSVPRPVREGVAAAVRARRSPPPEPAPARSLAFPPDVVDAAALREHLLDTDLFAGAPGEAEAYVADSLERFRITMALVPDLPPGTPVLELGANPYFLTRLLRGRGLEVTCANYFGERYEGLSRQVVTASRSGERQVYEFDQFNVERDRFPYDDGAFGLVLCCEIIEHLPNDPVHMLAEIHRVLAQPDGTLLLSTPNATRLGNLLRVLRGENPYEELSGHGTYGRHNREYTVDELRMLLEGCGYHVDDIFTMDVHQEAEELPRLPEVDPAHREDNIFALARPHGEPRWHYPRWLFASRHQLRRVVRPDLVAGHNHDLQSVGLHEAETLQGRPACWMAGSEVRVTLSPSFAGPGVLRVDGVAAPSSAGPPIRLSAERGAVRAAWTVACDDRPFSLSAPVTVEEGGQEWVLRADRTWSPASVGSGPDSRVLGVALCRVALDPA
ncbi:MAG TPA: methyltransferase domain-containing protein [Acidimicrobiales bacterium]|nr:methyltransferase domain-containing protein [Acidimicrobiales bacterium]